MVAITQTAAFQSAPGEQGSFAKVSTLRSSESLQGSESQVVVPTAVVALLIAVALLVAGLVGVYGGRFIDASRGIPQAVQASTHS